MDNMSIGCFRKKAHPMVKNGVQEWEKTETADTLNVYDNAESRTPILIVRKHRFCLSMNSKQFGLTIAENQCNTLAANDFKELQVVCYEVENG